MNAVDYIAQKADALHDRLTPSRFYPLLLGLLVLVGMAGLLMPGLPSGHDLYYHLSRIHTMAVDFRLGEVPAMINHEALEGYGYATGLFYPDLFLYPTALLHLCGLGIVASYKCLLVACMMAIAFSAYYCARKLRAPHFGAFAAALLYTWSSYLATDLFIRAALGEVFSFVFVPWILLGLYEIVFGDPGKFLYFSFGFLGLVATHSLSLLILTAVCAVFLLFNGLRLLREPRRLLYLAVSPVPTLLAGVAYLAPMVEQYAHLDFIIKGEKNEAILERCMPFLKLFLEIPTSKATPWIPSGIGLIFVIVALQRLRLTSRRTALELFRDMLLIAGVACLLMATDMPSWKGAFKPLAVIQFPWRFFGPATAFLAFGGGLTLAALAGEDRGRQRYWLWILLVGTASAWFLNVGYFYAARISEHDITRGFRPGRPQEASGIHYLPLGGLTDTEIRQRGDIVTPAHPLQWEVSRPRPNLLKVSFSRNAQGNLLELPLVPYHGYRAWLSDAGGAARPLQVSLGPNRLLAVTLPRDAASGEVTVRYEATKTQRLSQACSLLSALAFAGWLLWRRRRRAVSPPSDQ